MAIGGFGIPLPLPQAPSPVLPPGQSSSLQSITFDLVAGASLILPPGGWMIQKVYSIVQWRDPVSGRWLPDGNVTPTLFKTIISDGANFRLWNPKGFPVSATITNAGTAYVQATTTVTASARGSLWHAIVGGAVGTVTVGNDPKGNAGGTNFTLPPTIVISCPPSQLTGLPSTATALGGIPATATAAVSGGAVSAVTIDNAGAGYASAPTFQVIPDPRDPNIGKITVPALTAVLTGSGTVTAVVLDYAGDSAGAAPTLSFAGAGSSAAATANIVATGATDTITLQQIPTGI